MFLSGAILVVYIVTSVAGLTLLKMGGPAIGLRSTSGAILYAAGFGLWYLILLRLPLSRAFPLAAGGLVLGTQIAGGLFLREPLTAIHLVGVALIVGGVAIVSAYG